MSAASSRSGGMPEQGSVAGPTSATNDAVFTMPPPPARSLARIAYLQQEKTPLRYDSSYVNGATFTVDEGITAAYVTPE